MGFISKKADLFFQSNERNVAPYVTDRGEEGKYFNSASNS